MVIGRMWCFRSVPSAVVPATRPDPVVRAARPGYSQNTRTVAVGVVDVDGELVEVLDQVFDVLWLELSQVDRDPRLVQF